MGNILSQDEVDALLEAVEQGEVFSDEDEIGETPSSDCDTVAEYNFRRPDLITRDQLRGVTGLYEEFARELQASLSIFLRTNVDVRLVSAEQQEYNEFVFSLSDITHLVLFEMKPLPGMAVMEINLSLVFGIVDLLVGGEGDVETAIRKLTEVEVGICDQLVEIVFGCLSESLGSVFPVDIRTERYESSPEYVQAAPADAPVVVLTFDARIGLANGIINLCYPLPMIQALLRELASRGGQFDNYYGKVSPEDSRRQVLEALMDVPLQASVSLGEIILRAEEWNDLRPGDIVVLDNEVTEGLSLRIEDRRAFKGKPGRINGNLGFKVCERLESSVIPKQPSLADTEGHAQ